jgi:hypothetical protein
LLSFSQTAWVTFPIAAIRSFTGFRAFAATVTAADEDIFTALDLFGFAPFPRFLFPAFLITLEFATRKVRTAAHHRNQILVVPRRLSGPDNQGSLARGAADLAHSHSGNWRALPLEL